MDKNLDAADVVLEVKHLTKHYPIKKGLLGRSDACVHALEDVSFEVRRGETFAIVGESGCGKSTTGKCILRLTEPTSGTVMLDGQDFTKLSGNDLVDARKKLKLIFQDPYSSLNPRMDAADFDRRVANQPSDEYLRAHADTVLDNAGKREDLVSAIRSWWDARAASGWVVGR